MQNHECAGILDDILLEEEDIQIIHGGMIKNCERCFIVAKLPTPIKIGNDRIEKYVIIHWSHSGKAALTIRFSPVLQTSGRGIFLDAYAGRNKHEFKIRHTKSGPKRLNEARNILSKAYSFFSEIEQSFKRLKEQPFDNSAMQHYLDTIFPSTAEDNEPGRKATIAANRQADVWTIFTEEAAPTQWTAFTSICEYTDSKEVNSQDPEKKSSRDENKLDNIWFGTGSKLKAKAFQSILYPLIGDEI